MVRSRFPPSPVLGLLITGAILLFIEGIVLSVVLAFVITLAGNIQPFVGVGIEAVVLDFLLAVLTLLVALAYSREHSWGLGLAALILGSLSFLVGAGFLLGGMFIVLAGALAMFWDSVESGPFSLSESDLARRAVSAQPVGSAGSAPTAADWSPSRPKGSAGIVVYRPCPSCGELAGPTETNCPKCGSTLP